jgi:hypothetical protein
MFATAGSGDEQPRKPSVFSGVARVEKGHGWLFPLTASSTERSGNSLHDERAATRWGKLWPDSWRTIKAFRTRATRDPAARLTAPMKLAAFKNPLHKKISA